MTRRVAVTGAGVLSSLGTTAAETWERLIAGQVGIGPVTLFDVAGHRTRIAAEIPDFDASSLMTPKDFRRSSRADRIGLLAAVAAIDDAGIDRRRLRGDRAAVVLGGGGGLLEGEDYAAAIGTGSMLRPSRALPFFPCATAQRIASHLGTRGLVDTIVNACASSTVAIGLAARRVADGTHDVALAGGVEALARTTYAGFNALRLVDEAPCRPFDRGRSGLTLGECAAVLLLEPLEAARARGGRIYAEIAGFGLSGDGHHMTAPCADGEGLARSMRAALRSAGLAPEDVGHVNAHGTGTAQNDAAEIRALRDVLGARAPAVPVVSIKGMVGHCLAAAGAIEAFAAALSIHHGVLPPTAGFAQADEGCDLDFVPGRARPVRIDVALSNSCAFGGHNATLVLRRCA